MPSTIALVIIYNHRYDKNIELLEQLYKDRFSNIVHIVPFYNGDKPNVIPVYENSFYFQGYLVQAFSRYFKQEIEHYFFVADDMMINPLVNEHTYKAQLKIDAKTSYFPEIVSLHNLPYKWKRTQDAVEYNPKIQGVEAVNELPTIETATKILYERGFEIKPIPYKEVYTFQKKLMADLRALDGTKSILDIFKTLSNHLSATISNKPCDLRYPIVGGYSDIFLVSAVAMPKFIHYCGVFAATELFVELAIPTALALATKDIVYEKDIELKGKAMWTEEDYKIVEHYKLNLGALMADFPENHLYLHPIKLSKWKSNQ